MSACNTIRAYLFREFESSLVKALLVILSKQRKKLKTGSSAVSLILRYLRDSRRPVTISKTIHCNDI